MEEWRLEIQNLQHILTHYCDHLRPGDGSSVLRQDIGGGYVRCERCGSKYLPEHLPGNPRLLLRLQSYEEPTQRHKTA
jgi:hypothetical protein